MTGDPVRDFASGFNARRLPKQLQERLKPHHPLAGREDLLRIDQVYHGDARHFLSRIAPGSIALSLWSPPYFVGKQYETHMTFEEWQLLLKSVIESHFSIITPGGFLAINIADILCFKDSSMPRVQADVVTRRKAKVTRQDVIEAMRKHPQVKRHQLARI